MQQRSRRGVNDFSNYWDLIFKKQFTKFHAAELVFNSIPEILEKPKTFHKTAKSFEKYF